MSIDFDHDWDGRAAALDQGLTAPVDEEAAERAVFELLTALGVDLDALRERVEAGLVASDAELGEQIPFSGPAKKVLELVFREALRLGHNYVGTEHLLLGLLAEEESPAAQLIGVTHAAAEEHITAAE